MITRFASGLPVTFASSGDNYLVQVQNNGVNATSIDMPDYDGSGYKLNHNPRNGKPCFNTAAFSPNALGAQGNSKRRMFYGPGIDNYDMALHRVTELSEGCSLEFRVEMFKRLQPCAVLSEWLGGWEYRRCFLRSRIACR